jgi:hypothetical protein
MFSLPWELVAPKVSVFVTLLRNVTRECFFLTKYYALFYDKRKEEKALIFVFCSLHVFLFCCKFVTLYFFDLSFIAYGLLK